jgi:hypothetical protein
MWMERRNERCMVNAVQVPTDAFTTNFHLNLRAKHDIDLSGVTGGPAGSDTYHPRRGGRSG